MRAQSKQRSFAYWFVLVALLSSQVVARSAPAEDGYELWLRYRPVEAAWLRSYSSAARELVGTTDSATLLAARSELTRALGGLVGAVPRYATHPTVAGAIVFGSPRSSPVIAALHLDLHAASPDGYLIRTLT